MPRYRNNRDAILEKELADLEAEAALTANPPQEPEVSTPVVQKPAEVTIVPPTETNWEKRYSDLRSHSAKELNALKAEIEQLKNANETIQNNQLRETFPKPKNREELVEWMQEFPDVTGMIRALIVEEMQEVSKEAKEARKELEQNRHQVARQKAYADLLKAHPDFEEIKADLKVWIDEQVKTKGAIGKTFHHSLYEQDTDGHAAAATVSIYKLERDNKKNTRKNRDDLDAARSVAKTNSDTPRTNGDKPTFLESEIDAMPIRKYLQMEHVIEEARLDGRIVYDMTAGAR